MVRRATTHLDVYIFIKPPKSLHAVVRMLFLNGREGNRLKTPPTW
jgi:hypothetical protein